MTSITLTLSGNDSLLEAEYFPPIELDERYQYECGLVDFQSFNCIPNVDEENNKLVFGGAYIESDDLLEESEKKDGGISNSTEIGIIEYDDHFPTTIIIPTGSWEISDIANFIRSKLPDSVTFALKVNKNTLKCELYCDALIDFTHNNTIGPLLGFSAKILRPDTVHVSDCPIDILRVNAIRVECNIITGSYFNGDSGHTIHEFFPIAQSGYKITETPNNVIYLPVAVKSIRNVSVSIVDQKNRTINFRGENIVVRLHVRKVRT